MIDSEECALCLRPADIGQHDLTLGPEENYSCPGCDAHGGGKFTKFCKAPHAAISSRVEVTYHACGRGHVMLGGRAG